MSWPVLPFALSNLGFCILERTLFANRFAGGELPCDLHIMMSDLGSVGGLRAPVPVTANWLTGPPFGPLAVIEDREPTFTTRQSPAPLCQRLASSARPHYTAFRLYLFGEGFSVPCGAFRLEKCTQVRGPTVNKRSPVADHG